MPILHRFAGFQSPNYTPVPDTLFDELLPDLSGAELKVLLYIVRRTFGFKRASDNISLSQMLGGLRARDGRVLDRGVGLTKKTLLLAINSLEAHGVIFTERRRSSEKGDEPTTYRLNVLEAGWPAGAADTGKTPLPVGEKLLHGGGAKTPPGGWGKNYPTQETEGETDFDKQIHGGVEREQSTIHAVEEGSDLHGNVATALTVFGVSPLSAARFAASYPADYLFEKLDHVHHLVGKRSRLTSQNPAGYLSR